MPEEKRVVCVGPHTIIVEDTIVFVKWEGDISPSAIQGFFDLAASVANGERSLLAMQDLTRAGHFPPEARAYAAKETRTVLFAAFATFGAKIHMRVIASMLERAKRLLGRKEEAPIAMFATETEARAWLAAQRHLLRPGSAQETT